MSHLTVLAARLSPRRATPLRSAVRPPSANERSCARLRGSRSCTPPRSFVLAGRFRREVCACTLDRVRCDRPRSVLLLGGPSEVGAKVRAQTLRVALEFVRKLLRRHVVTPFIRRHRYRVHDERSNVNGSHNIRSFVAFVRKAGNTFARLATRSHVRQHVCRRDNIPPPTPGHGGNRKFVVQTA